MVKLLSDVIVRPLTLISNQILSTGIFPDALKLSKVVPIFKKGNTKDMSNYRPNSLLTSFSKIFDKVIHEQLYSFLNDNSLLSEK